MIGQTTDERRISPRVSFGGVVLVRNARQQVPCQALNLSETGILVQPSQRANPGHQFRVTFALPARDGGWVDVEGHLVHRTWIGRRISWGIQFAGVPTVVRGKLRQFVETVHVPAEPTPPRASAERRLAPVPIPGATTERVPREENTSRSLERPRSDKEPTRRVAISKIERIPGSEETRQVPREVIDRLTRGMADDEHLDN